jgi:hypothetical protein
MSRFIHCRKHSKNSMCEPISLEIQVIGFRLEGAQQSGTGNLMKDLIRDLGLNQIGPNTPHFLYKIQVTFHHPICLTFEISKRFSELVRNGYFPEKRS